MFFQSRGFLIFYQCLYLCLFVLPGEGQRALRLLALVRERQGLALVPGVADVAHVLRGMSWGGIVDTSGYDVTEGGDNNSIGTNNSANTDTSSGGANNNSTTTSTIGHDLVLGGHLDMVLDIIVQQSVREQQKRETLRSTPQGHKQQQQSRIKQQQSQQQSQQQELPVLTITSSGTTVVYVNNDSKFNNSNSISNSGSGNNSGNSNIIDGSGYVDMGAARALSSALITSLCRQGNRSIDTQNVLSHLRNTLLH